MLRVKSEKDTDIELGQLGSAVVKEERGEADIALEEEQENLQNQESIVFEVEDGRMLQADVKVEVFGVGEEEGGNQGAVGGVLGGNDQHDQQDPGDNGEGGEAKGAKPKKERKKKDKKKKVKEEDDDPFEVKLEQEKMRGF